jgi:transposase
MFSYVSAEERIPRDHPLRAIRMLVDDVLRDMSRDFSRVYATTGRPSIPPEQLLRALLLQIFYSIRSERLLMEQLEYNILFRWFVGLTMDDAVWAPTVFTKNRDRVLNDVIAGRFFTHVRERAQPYMSDEHFTVDGTLIEAWASQKSFQKKEDPPDGDGRNFHGQSARLWMWSFTVSDLATIWQTTRRKGIELIDGDPDVERFSFSAERDSPSAPVYRRTLVTHYKVARIYERTIFPALDPATSPLTPLEFSVFLDRSRVNGADVRRRVSRLGFSGERPRARGSGQAAHVMRAPPSG